jgi:hypothetical protein
MLELVQIRLVQNFMLQVAQDQQSETLQLLAHRGLWAQT